MYNTSHIFIHEATLIHVILFWNFLLKLEFSFSRGFIALVCCSLGCYSSRWHLSNKLSFHLSQSATGGVGEITSGSPAKSSHLNSFQLAFARSSPSETTRGLYRCEGQYAPSSGVVLVWHTGFSRSFRCSFLSGGCKAIY